MPGGRPRLPRQRKIIRGTFRKDRNPGREAAPALVKTVPRPPAALNRWAKTYWQQVAGELIEQGLLTTLDLGTFADLCLIDGVVWESWDAIRHPRGRRRAQTLKDYMRGGNSQTLPELATLRAFLQLRSVYEGKFGLSPASRNRIDVPAPRDAEDPMERLIHGA